jgi:hypothetical protein
VAFRNPPDESERRSEDAIQNTLRRRTRRRESPA